MASRPPARGDGVRRRPKDSSEQIARASAEAFSAHVCWPMDLTLLGRYRLRTVLPAK